MVQQAPRTDPLRSMRGSLQHKTLNSRTVKVARHADLPARRAIFIFEIVQY
jgi:hypothetical protein